jgi:ubiquinol-cytochrome c reductase iron-sulfur subunit
LAKPVRPVYQARQAAQAWCGRVACPGKLAKDIMAAVETTDDGGDAIGEGGVRRRDFINIAAVSFAGVGSLALLYPLVNQMNPSADVLALAQIDVDISHIRPGQAIKTIWRKQPIFIRNLTPAEYQAANAVDVSSLRDPQTLAERTKPGHRNWLITLGVCTHLGCVPLGAAEGETRGEYGGYFCPCHGSVYDTAARIRKGPAPRNLEVPDYQFMSPTAVRIG